MREHAGAVIFGGPMRANDPDDFVRAEIDWIGTCLKEDAPFLGICLGGQLIAHVIGADVRAQTGAPEKGYTRIDTTDEAAADPVFSAIRPRTSFVESHVDRIVALPEEATLLATLGDFPRVVAHAAELREPHRVARYIETLAGHFHKWYDTCRVRPRSDEELTDTHRTRLWLNDATRQVLANGLDLLGVSAPERM